jgi:hypothetical protein
MTIAQLPSNVSAIPEQLKSRLKAATAEPNWARILSAGALITGAVLLATGKRKAGIALTAVGATAALLEDTEGTKEIWNSIPGYIEQGQQVLTRIERFVEDIAEQGERVRKMVNQQIR